METPPEETAGAEEAPHSRQIAALKRSPLEVQQQSNRENRGQRRSKWLVAGITAVL
jgi:hypothetical protein